MGQTLASYCDVSRFAGNKLKALLGHDPTLTNLGVPLEEVASPWQATCEQNADYLQGLTFRPRRLAESPWTDAEDARLMTAINGLADGTVLKPTQGMRLGYFFSHHVMDRTRSESSCRSRVWKLTGRSRIGSWDAIMEELVDDDGEVEAGDSDEDSEDERVIPRLNVGLGL